MSAHPDYVFILSTPPKADGRVYVKNYSTIDTVVRGVFLGEGLDDVRVGRKAEPQFGRLSFVSKGVEVELTPTVQRAYVELLHAAGKPVGADFGWYLPHADYPGYRRKRLQAGRSLAADLRVLLANHGVHL